MAFDWNTEIEMLTREDNLTQATIDWAVESAKVFYVCGDASNYDEDESIVDNKLVSILASAFVLVYVNSLEVPAEFSLDEFTLKEKVVNENEEHLNKYFKTFFSWLDLYQCRGCTLQYEDNGSLLVASEFTASDLIADLVLPENID